MLIASEEKLKSELMHQLQLFQDVYKITISLADVCASATLDQSELDRLILDRENLINHIADSQKSLNYKTSQESPEISDVLLEICSVLKKTTDVDEEVRKGLEKKQNLIKSELLSIQTSKKADKAYHNPVLQNEGYFIDSKKN